MSLCLHSDDIKQDIPSDVLPKLVEEANWLELLPLVKLLNGREQRRRQTEEAAHQAQAAAQRQAAEQRQAAARRDAVDMKVSPLMDSTKLISIELRVGLDRFNLSSSLLTSPRVCNSVLGALAKQALQDNTPHPCITFDRDGGVYKYIIEWMLR